jgi:hypothetical protein
VSSSGSYWITHLKIHTVAKIRTHVFYNCVLFHVVCLFLPSLIKICFKIKSPSDGRCCADVGKIVTTKFCQVLPFIRVIKISLNQVPTVEANKVRKFWEVDCSEERS